MASVLNYDRWSEITDEYRERNRRIAGLLADIAVETESLGWGWDTDREGNSISETLRCIENRAKSESVI